MHINSIQLVGAEGSLSSIGNICSKLDELACPTAAGQPNCNCLDKQKGKPPLKTAIRSGSSALGVVSGEGYHCKSRTHSRSGERQGRPGVETQTGFQRLEDGFQSISTDFQPIGTTASGSVRSETQRTVTSVFQFQTRPRSSGSGCICSGLVESDSICLPTFSNGREMSTEDQGREGRESSNSDPSMEELSMVPTTPPHEHQQSLPSSPIKEPANKPSGRSASPHGSGRTDPHRLAGIRQSLESKGISEKAINLICASWRRRTEKSYSSAWGLWQGWCSKGYIDPLSASLSDIANFLSSEFENGKQYSTLNTYRSAISATHPPIEGYPVGQHPIICRLLQGMFNERPRKPRYQYVWDVGDVVEFLKSMAPNEALSYKDLTMKLATIMAITNADRASDLHALDRRFIQETPEGMLFRIPGLTKTRRSGGPREVLYPKFVLDDRICPVSILSLYLKVSQKHCIQSDNKQPLFIAVKKPHKAVTAATISRWLKEILCRAGVDTNIFKAHSTRTASTSAAKVRGVSTADIMKVEN